MVKQKPEEKARQHIDKLLESAGWTRRTEIPKKEISKSKLREFHIPLAEQRHIVAEVKRRLSIADGVEKTVA